MRRLALFTPRALSWHVILFLSAILLVPACDDGNDVTAPVPTVGTVAGTVVTSATGDPVAGAQVSLGTATATTGPDGRFELTDLPAGPATLRCVATGFEDLEAYITVRSGRVAWKISLWRAGAPLWVYADIGALSQHVAVSREGQDVTDAAVTVNGVPILPSRYGGFQRSLPLAVPAGSPLDLQVRVGGVTVEATGNVPETAILTAPAKGTVHTDSLTVTWTSATDPDYFVVAFGEVFPTFFSTTGTARELRVAVSDIFGGIDLTITHGMIGVFALNKGSFTGPVDNATMNIWGDFSVDTGITSRTAPMDGNLGVYDLTAMIERFSGTFTAKRK